MYHFTIDRAHFLIVYKISETKINEAAALRSLPLNAQNINRLVTEPTYAALKYHRLKLIRKELTLITYTSTMS
jgi:hypothetical protein